MAFELFTYTFAEVMSRSRRLSCSSQYLAVFVTGEARGAGWLESKGRPAQTFVSCHVIPIPHATTGFYFAPFPHAPPETFPV